MNLSVIEKIMTVFKYAVSSFFSIGLFILCLLLFLILLININKKNKYATYLIITVFIVTLLGIVVASTKYFIYSIDWLIKGIMKYIYFPSSAAYYVINLIAVIILVYSIKSTKLTKFKRIFNYVMCIMMFYFFISFVGVVTYNKLDIKVLENLYKNNTVLSIVQVSNILLFIWIIYTLFYRLYLLFKKKYDKKNEEN